MELTIALPGARWHYDPGSPLGPPGGFGEVFRGRSDGGEPVAIKRLKIAAAKAAHRELRIANLLKGSEFQHLLPFFDAGQDAESGAYFVVMPIAERSLAEYLNESGPLDELAAISILLSIAAGLNEVPDIVHRDLKPGNILFHASKWKLADFGIAKFIEESTSLETLKGCLSPQYAAPEQWNLQRPTHATDVYALGCIGYTLLTGAPPFQGQAKEDFRNQHLHAAPPNNLTCSNRLRSALSMMLRKTPEVRPGLSRVIRLLEQVDASVDDGFSGLAEAGAAVAAEVANEEATAAKEAEDRARRQSLAREAKAIFESLCEEFLCAVVDAASVAKREDVSRVRLGGAVLEMKLIGPRGGYSVNPFERSGWDVLLGGKVAVRQANPTYVWSSSLWYAKLSPHDEYRWREISYFFNPLLAERPPHEPFALEDGARADEAAAATMGTYNIAFGPVCIDDEDKEEFMTRWSDLYRKAVSGQLRRPSSLPL